MATKAEWKAIRDELALASALGVYFYRCEGLHCAIGWLCREELKAVPDDPVRLTKGGISGVGSIMMDPTPDDVRRAVRDRLTQLGLTVDEARALQFANDRGEGLETVQAYVLAWIDRRIEEAKDGDA